ncbi:hypothetical protein [uncultured Thiothrix sp.]|jgi:hypothetical protein|uniref:hypothetical protein n=1 Tax=uncultured Thiothrix sp. TaxID=223185 RepID=UPI00262B2F9D|nr:hypothetical protein [uncultured Thiothrix sp.]HMT94310.1 hypothetical protein [Thiolinea sp.]
MTTVFISGSRHIRALNSEIKARLQNIVNNQFEIIVGDAFGVDKAVQHYLAAINYPTVRVFCSGSVCRNNLGNWAVEWINVDPSLKGRAFYTEKDKAMAAQADYGFVLWDGKSQGSLNNIHELLRLERKLLLWYAPEKIFHTITTTDDLQKLINKPEPKVLLSESIQHSLAM